jgi:hypothetical protein
MVNPPVAVTARTRPVHTGKVKNLGNVYNKDAIMMD